MTTNPTPPSPAPAQGDPTSRPAPPCSMLAMCVECCHGIELPLPIDQRTLSIMLAQVGWFISVLAPPSPDPAARVVIGPLCAACAQQVYPPEIYQAVNQRRQQLLQTLQQTPQQTPTPTAQVTPEIPAQGPSSGGAR